MKIADDRSTSIRGFTLVELLVVIAIIGTLVALLLPAVQAAREAARRTQCTNNLKNLGLALLNYHETDGHFPAAAYVRPDSNDTILTDSRLFSNWAIEILPFIEQQPLFDSFTIDEMTRLTDESNRPAIATELAVMLCPSDQGQGQPFVGGLSERTWARGNYGLNGFQFWPNLGLTREMRGEQQGTASEWVDFNLGMGGVNGPLMRIAKITDGTTNTIMLGEMRVGLSSRDRRGVWAMGMCGSNFHCRHAANLVNAPNSCGLDEDDVMGGADIVADVGEATLRVECMHPDSAVSQSGQSGMRSVHVGGLFAAFADGSVRFIDDFIDAGRLGGSAYIGQVASDLLPENFRLWQQLNVSADGMLLGGSP